MQTEPSFVVVGHRGNPEYFPENSLVGLTQTVAAGVTAVEFDVQCTQDGELILLHDEDFMRVAGVSAHAHSVSFAQACSIDVAEEQRFGSKFRGEKTPSLTQVCHVLQNGPDYIFVEIKSEAVGYLGFDGAMQKLLEATAAIAEQRIFISYHYEFLSFLKQETGQKIGWVMTYYDDASLAQADKLQPEYLICNKNKLHKTGKLPSNTWAWFVYDVVELQEAIALQKRGVKFIESWNPQALLQPVPA